MTTPQAEKFVALIVKRAELLVRLSRIRDPRTVARYLVIAHFDLHERFKAVRLALDEDPSTPPK